MLRPAAAPRNERRHAAVRIDEDARGTSASGKTAVVTGADSGIGLMTARMLLEEGVRVIIADQKAEEIEAAAHALLRCAEVHPAVIDVTRLAITGANCRIDGGSAATGLAHRIVGGCGTGQWRPHCMRNGLRTESL